ncbi:MAG: YihY/virulence factor BrkB family protein [Elusimicrobia bacterium]|nr:YihY/virulence factor BrkB family protein [Elusimicrobiota bacterium]
MNSMKNIYKKLKSYFIGIKNTVVRDDIFGSAAEMSYMLTLSIFPLMISFIAMFSFLGNSSFVTEGLDALSRFAPAEVIIVIKAVLREVVLLKGKSIVAIIGFLTTLYLASNSISVIIKCLNKSDKTGDKRSFFYKKFLSVVMVFVYAVFLFLSVNIIVFGKTILNLVSTYIRFIPIETSQMLLFLRWPVTFLLIFVIAAISYYILPAAKRKIFEVLPGSIFFTIFWMAGSMLFSVYIDNFNSYNKVYGSLAAFAVLMIWLYFTSIIILIGGEINNYIKQSKI